MVIQKPQIVAHRLTAIFNKTMYITFPNYNQQDAMFLYLFIYLFLQTLYMFQAVPPPKISST